MNKPWLPVVILASLLVGAGCATRRLSPAHAPRPAGEASETERRQEPRNAGGDLHKSPSATAPQASAIEVAEALQSAESALARGDLRLARRWALEAQRGDPGEEPALLLARIYRRAVTACAGTELDFDDRLVYEMAAQVLKRVGSRRTTAAAAGLEDLLPTPEDRFYNHYERPRKECYKWLLE